MRPSRILVVHASAEAREALGVILASDPRLEMAGACASIDGLLEQVRSLEPHLVLLDSRFADAMSATRSIMEQMPTPVVLMVPPGTVLSDPALRRSGAVGVLVPPVDGHEDVADQHLFLRRVLSLATVMPIRRYPRERLGRGPESRGVGMPLIGLAASTGGPGSVLRLLHRLPRDLPASVLLVQHIAPGFVEGLTRWLDANTPLQVRLAVDGEAVRPGTVHVAPDDHHLCVTRARRTALLTSPPQGGFRPAGSVLLESLAEAAGPRSAAVVLTGVGSDGLDGAARIANAGGLVLAQDEATSAVFGMPRAVIEAGYAHEVGPVESIAEALIAWAKEMS